MTAQRAHKPTRNNRYAPRPVVRARVGLAMRRGMNFGIFGDAEPMIRAGGLALAPISTGDASLSVNGVTVLPTAQASDIDSGALKGLVLPGGSPDADGEAAVQALLLKAREKGVPVLAFGEGVVHAARAAGADPADLLDVAAVLTDGSNVYPLADADAVTAAAGRIG